MKLEKWALIAEIVSGLAVVVTLIFLILGIRENTSVTRASVYSDITDSINNIQQTLFEDPELSRLYDAYTGRKTGELSEADESRTNRIAIAILRVYEKAYFGRQYGVIGDPEWGRVQSAICLHHDLSVAAGWPVTSGLPLYTDEFQDFMRIRCLDQAR